MHAIIKVRIVWGHMTINKVKILASKSKIFRIALIIMTLVLFGLYLIVFFTKGIKYDDTFLKKEVFGADNHYMGKNQWGGIHITVKGIKGVHDNIEVTYRLPNNIVKSYTVSFEKYDGFREKVIIMNGKGDLIFEGEYREGDMFLIDKSGEPLFEGIGQIFVNGQNPYNADHKIYLTNIVKLATFENETIRGNAELFIIALFLIIITAIDMKFPLFYFELRHFLSVKDPEPSDFYITMQRISWYAYPIIIFILLIAAIF
jgi:hypothetical protein